MMAHVPLLAHHGSTAYETTKVLVFKDAMVTKVLWSNPHVIITFDAKDDKENVEHWNAEAGTPSTLNTLELTLIIDDPKIYTKPFVLATSRFRWIPDQEEEEQLCVPSEAAEYLKLIVIPADQDQATRKK